MFLYYFFSLIVVHLLVSIVHYLPNDFYFLDKSSTVGLAPSGKYFWPVFGVRNWSVHLFLRYLRIFDDFYSRSILQRLLFLEPKIINSRSIAHFLYQAQLLWFSKYFCEFSFFWWENLFMLNKSIKPWGRIIQGGQKERIFFRFGYIPRPSSGQLHISRHHLDKELNLDPLNLCLYQLTKILLLRLCLIFIFLINLFYLVVWNVLMYTLQVP